MTANMRQFVSDSYNEREVFFMSYGEEQQKEIEFTDSNKATITDTSGATMNLSYTQMKGVHEDVPEK